MLNRKIEGHIKANPFKPPWAAKYFISTRCKKFYLTPMGCYSRAGAYMQSETFTWGPIRGWGINRGFTVLSICSFVLLNTYYIRNLLCDQFRIMYCASLMDTTEYNLKTNCTATTESTN